MAYNKEEYYSTIKKYLLGATITELYYEVLNDEEEYWEISRNIHSVDMNIIFKREDEKIVRLTWDNNFNSYGIGINSLDNINGESDNFKVINI